MNFALVNPQHKNVSYPDRQMIFLKRIKQKILHVARNDISADTTEITPAAVKLKMQVKLTNKQPKRQLIGLQHHGSCILKDAIQL